MKKITCLLLLTVFINSVQALAAVPAVQPKAPEKLIPIGQTAGFQLTARGIIVVGYTDTENGSPAQKGGVMPGDLITHINGSPIAGAQQFQEAVQKNGGGEMELTIRRKNSELKLKATPKQDDKEYKLGAWIRDNVSGIGTITFYDPESKVFGALGHGINDSSLKALLPLDSGIVLNAQVSEIRKGLPGQPGELKGAFSNQPSGSLLLNSGSGLFGILESMNSAQESLPVALSSDIEVGKAHILANVSGSQVESFNIEIVRLMDMSSDDSRNFMVKITDERLIEKTGGIVQGMSGSPIIQNGKLIGAVTHVLVSDPKKGYGIFIGNMLNEVYGTANQSFLHICKDTVNLLKAPRGV